MISALPSAQPHHGLRHRRHERLFAPIQPRTRAAGPYRLALKRAIAVAVGYIQADEVHEAELSACRDGIIELGRRMIREEGGA